MTSIKAVEKRKPRFFCQICKKYGKKNAFTRGIRDLQKSAVKRNVQGTDHNETTSARSSQKVSNFTSQGIFANDMKQRAILRTVYYMAREDISNRKFLSLNELQTIAKLRTMLEADGIGDYEREFRQGVEANSK